MGDITAISTRLRNTALQTQTYHELFINFPATELLPDGRRPHLDAPKGIGHRDKPIPEATASDATDIDFFHLFHVERSRSEATHVPNDPDPGCLSSSIGRICGAAGRSVLDVVAWLDTDGQLVHYVRLSTIFEVRDCQVREAKELAYRGSDWADSLVMNKAEPWAELLEVLMH